MINLSTANIREVRDELEGINPDDEFAYEKAILSYLKIRYLPILLFDIPIETSIFKSRTHNSSDLFDTVSDVFVPPKKAVQNFARCNRPFQSKFYCSENRPTSFMELAEYWAETKDYGEKLFVTIGRWIIKKPMTSIIVTTPDSSKRISEYDKTHGNALDKFLADYKGETLEANIIFYNYLFEKFRRPAKHDIKNYIITTAYCNLAMSHTKNQAVAISYPSVPFNGQGVNYCINSSFCAFDNLELTHVMQNEFTITENENKKHSFTESNRIDVKEVNIKNNELKW